MQNNRQDKKSKSNFIRIIGGKWRSRRIVLANDELLRPTPDRVRETIFNWLMMDLKKSLVLDLFAGSGALGFEALSRGAKDVIFVEKSNVCFQQLVKTANMLEVDNPNIVNRDAIEWLLNLNQSINLKFDIVFIDPPYKLNLVPQILKILLDKKILNTNSKVYFEHDSDILLSSLPGYKILKHNKAGNIHYYLAAVA